MAKNRSRSRGRDASTVIANRRLPATLSFSSYEPPSPATLFPSPQYVAGLEDRRLYKPDRGLAPPAALNRNASRIVAPKYSPPFAVRFADPRLVSICAKRKIRREVLFALGKGGKRGRLNKPRRNFWSRVSC